MLRIIVIKIACVLSILNINYITLMLWKFVGMSISSVYTDRRVIEIKDITLTNRQSLLSLLLYFIKFILFKSE